MPPPENGRPALPPSPAAVPEPRQAGHVGPSLVGQGDPQTAERQGRQR